MSKLNLGCIRLLVVRAVLAAIFGYAGWSKLAAPQFFTATIIRLQLVPFSSAEWVASTVPVVELLIALWLLSGRRLGAAGLSIMWLTAAFAFAVGQALVHGLDFDCHCFGVTQNALAPGWVLVRAIVLFGGGVLVRVLALSSESRGVLENAVDADGLAQWRAQNTK